MKAQNRPIERGRHVFQCPQGADKRVDAGVRLISHRHCHALGEQNR